MEGSSPPEARKFEARTPLIEISDGNQTLKIKSKFLVCNHLQFEVLIGNNILERYLNKLNYRKRSAEFNVSNEDTIEIPF